jgi:putative phosphoribosyl transferase
VPREPRRAVRITTPRRRQAHSSHTAAAAAAIAPRNRLVAHVLQESRLATLLLDLLSAEEEALDVQTGELRFDIPLLAERLVAATDWGNEHEPIRGLPIGYFGASTGAAAALEAAAQRPAVVGAIVSRGGRPDLAAKVLGRVRAPTLLIVGAEDHAVMPLNRDALDALNVESALATIPGATHLFEEPGALEQVAELARDWLTRHLGGRGRA